MEAPAVLRERRDHTLLITINRPERKNAVNAAVSTGIGEALEELQQDATLRVAVITGAGETFCAGADLKELAAGRRTEAPGHHEWGFAGIVAHFVDKPLVAALNGPALGGGAEIALACDIVLAAEHAVLGLPEVSRGLMAAGGGALRLARQVPAKVAAHLLYTGDPLSATDAERWGVINTVVSQGTVLDAALAVADRIARNAPLAVQATKRVVHQSTEFPLDWESAAWAPTIREMRHLLTTADFQEGARAFAERREPQWQSR